MKIIQYIEQDKKLIIKVITGILLFVIAFVFYLIKNTGEPDLTVSKLPTEGAKNYQALESSQTSDTAIASPQMIIVDIAGAVVNPSVVELPAGSRVFEAVEKAGGLTSEADVKWINQAEMLTDGQKIYIPTKQELKDIGTDVPLSDLPGIVKQSGQGRININTADAETLQQLPGIGPVTAQKIIDFRNKNGKFCSIEEITDVSGIGEKTLAKFKDKITI